MIETGLELLDAIINNPIQSVILFVGLYVVYRIRNTREIKHFKYDIREFKELWECELFPARYEYSCPEYMLMKSKESQSHESESKK